MRLFTSCECATRVALCFALLLLGGTACGHDGSVVAPDSGSSLELVWSFLAGGFITALGVLWAPKLLARRANGRKGDSWADLNDFVATLPISVRVQDIDDDYRYVACNEEFAKLFGRSVNEVVGCTDAEVRPLQDNLDHFREVIAELVVSGGGVSSDIVSVTLSGREFTWRAFRFLSAKPGQRRLLYTAMVDISDVVSVQKKYASLSELVKVVFRETRSCVFRIDRETRKVESEGERGNFWRFENGHAALPKDVVFSEDLDEFSTRMTALYEGRGGVVDFRYRAGFSGELRNYRVAAVREVSQSGKIAVVGLMQDVTASTLRDAEQTRMAKLLELFLDATDMYLFAKDVDNDFRFVFANDAMGRLVGLTHDEVIGKCNRELFGSEKAVQFDRHDRETASSRTDQTQTSRIFDANGVMREFLVTKRTFTGAENHRLLVGLGRDVTDMQALKSNQKSISEALSAILLQDRGDIMPSILDLILERFQGSSVVLLSFDARGGKIAWRYGGGENVCSKEQVASLSFKAVDPWYCQLLEKRSLAIPDVSQGLERSLSPWNKCFSSPIISSFSYPVYVEGKLWGTLCVGFSLAKRDVSGYESDFLMYAAGFCGLSVTCSTLAQSVVSSGDKLRAMRQCLEASATLANTCSFMVNRDTRDVDGTANMATHLPIEDGRLLPVSQWMVEDDVAEYRKRMEELLTGRVKTLRYQYRATVHGLSRLYRTVIGYEAASNCLNCVIQDITDDAGNAGHLNITWSLWESVLDNAPFYFFVKDPNDNYRYRYCNAGFAKFVGFKSARDVVGKTDYELFTSIAEADAYVRADSESMSKPGGCSLRETSTDNCGRKHSIVTRKLPYQDSSGARYLLGICQNKTELLRSTDRCAMYEDVISAVSNDKGYEHTIKNVLGVVLEQLGCGYVCYLQVALNHTYEKRWDVVAPDKEYLKLSSAVVASLWKSFNTKWWQNTISVTDTPITLEISGHDVGSMQSATVVGIPVVLSQCLCVVVLLAFEPTRSIGENEQDMSRQIANVLCLVESREAQKRLLVSAQQRSKIILDNVAQPIWLHDGRGVVTYVNKAAQMLYPDGAAMCDDGAPFSCRKSLGCQMSGKKCPVAQVLGDRGRHLCHVKLGGRDYLVDARPVHDADGRFVRIVKSATDISSYNALMAERTIVMERIENMVHERDAVLVLRNTLKVLCDHLSATRCCLFTLDVQAGTVSKYLESCVQGVEPLPEISNRSAGNNPGLARRFVTSTIASFQKVPKLRTVAGLDEWRDVLVDLEVKSLYCYRVVVREKLWGFLALTYEVDAHELEETQVACVSLFAKCIELLLLRKVHESDMLEALRKAQEADNTKSTFLACMSHEIRTPLNAVIGYADLLRGNELPLNIQRDYLDSIVSGGRTLLELINNILDLSRLEANQMHIVLAKGVFADVAHSATDIFGPMCAQKGLELKYLETSSMPMVWIDAIRLKQVLFNLIGNAVKFTDQGSVTLSVEFEPRDATVGALIFSVTDTGIGISEDDQVDIFGLFVQARSQTGTEISSKGSGLGLHLCKRLIESMQGNIDLRSQPGQGSCFTVTLNSVKYVFAEANLQRIAKPVTQGEPLGRAVKVAKPSSEAFSRNSTKDSSATAKGDGPSLEVNKSALSETRVLLVDDIAANLNMLGDTLKLSGYDPLKALSGREALEVMGREKIDCVLTDLWMPGMDGAAFAAAVRADERFKDVRIAAVTGDTSCYDKFDMTVFDEVLSKPIMREKVMAFLRNEPIIQLDGL